MSLELDNALSPWSGEWFIEPPRGLRLINIHVYTAEQLLTRGSKLSNWQAAVLQQIVCQEEPLSSLQRHYLDRICDEVTGSEVAG